MAAPLPVVHLNGRFLPLKEARLSPLDRGFLFGDGVYEVIPAYAGRLFHLPAHLKRLQYSLDGIRLKNPLDDAEWTKLLEELVDQNGGGDQAVYLQVSRGADTGRDHSFPASAPPTVYAMCSPLSALAEELKTRGAKVMTLQDFRWHRCDIKCTALLGNVLLRQQATEAGCHEAILLRDGHATEGTASGLFIVKGGALITAPDGPDLLPSITRDVVLMLAEKAGLPCRRERIPAGDLEKAEEIWLVSSTREVYPVTEIDGRPAGGGKPGPLWKKVYDLFQQHKREQGSHTPPDQESPLKFPTTFPVKIMGRDEPGFHDAVAEILARHVAPLGSLPVTRQASREGRFVSITVTIEAQSREQLDALYRDLSAHELVLMAL